MPERTRRTAGRVTYTRLPGDTCGDDNDVGALERLAEAIVVGEEALDLGGRRDVRQVGSDTGRVDDIVEAKLSISM